MKNLVLAKKRRGLSVAALRGVRIETLNMAMIFSVIALAVFYLFMASNISMANYRKVLISKNIDVIKMEIMKLNLELSNKRSIGFLKEAARGLNLVVSKSIQYIKISGPVAKQ